VAHTAHLRQRHTGGFGLFLCLVSGVLVAAILKNKGEHRASSIGNCLLICDNSRAMQ